MKIFSKLFFGLSLIILGYGLFGQPVVSFNASETEACAPVNIIFTNTSSGCSGAATYYWQAGTGDVSNNENPVFNYSNGGVYTVSLTVTCDGFDVTETMQITIFDPPVANFDDTQIKGCIPYNAVFADLSTLGDAPIDTWQWYFGDGTTGSTQNPSHLYGSTGTYNVSLIVTDENECTNQITHNALISVAGNPTASFYGDNPTWCTAPHTVNFFSTVTTTFGSASTIVWDFGDGSPAGSGASPSHTYNSTGVYDVSITVTDNVYGCETVVTQNDYVRITIAEPNYSVLEGNVVCKNTEVHFVNQTGYSCSWQFGDGGTSYQNTPVHTYNTGGNMSVVFTVDPGGPCEASTTFILLVEEVTASFTTSPSNLFSCTTPFTVNFTNTSSANATSYNYYFQDGGSSTLPNPSHSYNSPGVYQPTLTVTTANNCVHTFIGPLITINSPDASFVGDTIEGCEPLTIDFTYNGTTPLATITNWNWNFGNGQTNPSGTNTASSTYNSGDYTVTLTVTDNNNCTNVGTLEISVGEPYFPTIDVVTYEDHDPLPSDHLCPQDSVELYLWDWNNPDIDEFTWWIDSTDNQGGDEYQMWQFDQDTGWITIHMITVYNGCRDTLLWDSVYISGPIIDGISSSSECATPLDYLFTLDYTEADYWDWFTYYITGGVRTDLGSELGSTDDEYSFTYPYQGSFWVQVIAYNTESGCEYIDSVQITISSPQALFVIIDDEVCIDEQVVFYGGTSVNVMEYYWDYGDGTNSGWISNPSSPHAYTTVGYFTVTLTVRDGNGCENSMTDEIHVLGPEIHITADETHGCNSLSVNFTENIISDDPITWIYWEFGDGQHSYGSGTVSHNYLQAGVYSVTVSAGTLHNCEASVEFPDFITVVSVNANFSSPDQFGCVGEDIVFNAFETDESYTYTWQFGDGEENVGHDTTATHQYTSGGIYNVYLKVDDGYGCIEEQTLNEFIIIQQPIANFSVANDNLPCYPVEPDIIPNCSVVPAGTALYYEWIMGTGDTLYVEDPELYYTLPGTYTITLNLSTYFGCTDSFSHDITINGPYAEAEISDTMACVGQDISFELVNQQNVDEFVWVVGGGDSYTEESFTHSYDLVPPQGFYPVNLTLTSGTCVVTFIYNVYVFSVTAGLMLTDTESVELPEGLCSPFDALLTSVSENDIYRQWYINGVETGSGNNPEPYTFTNSTAFDQTVTVSLVIEDDNGCTDSVATTIDVYALPQVLISNDTVICRGDGITIYAAGGISYNWYPDNHITDVSVQAPGVDPEENMTYYVDVTNERDCVKTDSVRIVVQQEPEIFLIPAADTIIIGDTVFSVLTANQENLSYLWTPPDFISCTDCPEPYFNPEESTRYNLTVEDSMHCFRYHYYIDIVVNEQYTLDVPGAFMPLGSEGNRLVYVKGFGIRKLLHFRIYNRWGEEVFYTDDIHQGWDGYYNGQLQNIDNYSYYVEAEMFDGSIQSKKGNIMLIR
ncbi:MAG TPA: PKD domain-containing protein [Bacteroidales bacterium]|nr:PKD domain-containing protein [Bacteroidales bacterium]